MNKFPLTQCLMGTSVTKNGRTVLAREHQFSSLKPSPRKVHVFNQIDTYDILTGFNVFQEWI